MSFSSKFAEIFKRLLPSPFTIAILLSIFVFVMALALPGTQPAAEITSYQYTATKDSVKLTAASSDQYGWSTGEHTQSITVPVQQLEKGISLQTQTAGTTYVNEAKIDLEDGTIQIDNNMQSQSKFLSLVKAWESEMWDKGLLAFLVQMMLMLALGHVLALSSPVNHLIRAGVGYCNTNARAAMMVCMSTILVSLFNWGLGLIFGAVLARKVGEYAVKKNIPLNYGLIGAAGYSGLMVWHGGISGSAPIKVSEDGAIHQLLKGDVSQAQLVNFPDSIAFDDTVFSTMNITISIALIVILPLSLYFLAKKDKLEVPVLNKSSIYNNRSNEAVTGAEKLDHSKLLTIAVGVLITFYSLYTGFRAINADDGFKFINPDYINLFLLGLCLICHTTIFNFLNALNSAIIGTSGILIQFPLYFGILGLMKASGLMSEISDFFISVSTQATYPIYTFFSAGLVNIFVPSGGGQWAVQGPIVLKAATELNVPLSKSIMALAYGDQLTNMLQPFWALPLLGITGLKAKQILPYTLLLMIIGAVIFITGLLIF